LDQTEYRLVIRSSAFLKRRTFVNVETNIDRVPRSGV
jgi:hypothetical protein